MRAWAVVSGVAMVTLLVIESGLACSNARGVWFHYHDWPGVERARFLAGELGVLEPSFDAVYLFVAYRYLTERPLSEATREHIEAYWSADASSARVDTAGWGPGISPVRRETITHEENTRYLYYLNCNRDAFATATATLDDRKARFGEESLTVRRWLGAQHQVFENCAKGASIPRAPGDDWGALKRADRQYQIAAAHFYARNFLEAATRFNAIAEGSESPWRDIAAYLVARAFLRQALVGDGPRDEYLLRAERQLENVLKDVGREAVHQPAQKHLDYVRALREPLQKLAGLEASLLSELDASFPATWRDYRWISRRVVEPGPELNEWLRALRGYPADALEKAYQRKKDSHDLSWLVLMLMRATSRDPWLDEVLDAAATIGPESPAFWTASYYRARLLLDAGRIDAARQLLDTLPAEDALSLSDHNRFRGLRARAARSAGEFLFHGAMVPVQVGSTDGVRIFSYPGDGLEALRDGRSFFERDVIASINGYFQPWLLAEGARNEDLPEHLRRELALVAFSRAFVSGDGETAVDVARLASELTPELEASLAEFRTAGSDSERDFAGALAMLRFPGLAPNLRGAASRVAPLDQVGAFRIVNWWCVIGASGVEEPVFIDSEANAALPRLSALEPAPIHLGEIVFRWSDPHRDDPRVPEALHLVVRATRYGCEWGRDQQRVDYGEVSKRAFDTLHRRYPNSPWTEKTKYWYR